MQCAIYTRVSTDNQAEKEYNSCEAQEEKIKAYIRSQENMKLYKVYTDPGFSGASLERSALREMLDDIIAGKIDCVLTYKIDRLTRSPKDFYTLIELFDKHGVAFISVTSKGYLPNLSTHRACHAGRADEGSEVPAGRRVYSERVRRAGKGEADERSSASFMCLINRSIWLLGRDSNPQPSG